MKFQARIAGDPTWHEIVSLGTEPRAVAQYLGEAQYGNQDFPEIQAIEIRDPEGILTQWIVVAEPSITFRARPADTKEWSWFEGTP